MDEHYGLGERVGKRVVISDDQFEAEVFGDTGLGHAGDAAVDRDDEAGTVGGQCAEGLAIETIALLEAIGHIP